MLTLPPHKKFLGLFLFEHSITNTFFVYLSITLYRYRFIKLYNIVSGGYSRKNMCVDEYIFENLFITIIIKLCLITGTGMKFRTEE